VIKWNEVTWYSKLLAIIFFIGVLPILCFFIGIEYKSVQQEAFVPLLSNVSNNLNKKEIILNSGSILLAMPNTSQEPYNYIGSPIAEYFIVSKDAQKGVEKQIALIKSNFAAKRFGFLKGIVYFINPGGELESLNIKSGNHSITKIPGIIPTAKYLNDNTLSDFLIVNDDIFYLKGECSSDISSCVLGQYNLVSGSNKIVVEDLGKQTREGNFTGTSFIDFDSESNTLKIHAGSGDAGISSASLYSIDLTTSTLKKIGSAGSYSCDALDGTGAECSSSDRKSENENNMKFTNLSLPAPIICNGTTISFTQDGIKIDGKDYRGDYYVGCVN